MLSRGYPFYLAYAVDHPGNLSKQNVNPTRTFAHRLFTLVNEAGKVGTYHARKVTCSYDDE